MMHGSIQGMVILATMMMKTKAMMTLVGQLLPVLQPF
jgi:hypothetical protein